MKRLISAFATVIVGLVAGLSTLFPRDGMLTVGIESFEPSEIVAYRMWEEHPAQVLSTFFPSKSTQFFGLAGQDKTSQNLAERISLIYGSASVNTETGYFDLASDLSEEEQSSIVASFQELTYYTTLPCPHDEDQNCSVGVGWNRDFTKQQDVSFFFIRATDNKYIFVDQSLLEMD